MTKGAICAPAPEFTKKKFYYCEKCKKRRLFELKAFEWYPPHANCLTCDALIQFGGEE